MRSEDVTLTVDGTDYEGELAGPDGDTDHGVVLLPGGSHGPYGDVFDRLAEALADAGVALLRFETWGDEEGLPAAGDKTDEALFAEYDAAVEWMHDSGYDRVDVVGKSFGGRIPLVHRTGGVGRLVLWAPFLFLADGETVETLDPPEEVTLPTVETSALSDHDLPVDVLQGDADHIPVENARELADALPDARVHVVEGADHSFVGGDPEVETVERTLDLLAGDGGN